MQYALAFPKYKNRPMYYEGKSADVDWIIDEAFGYFSHSIDAKRAYLIAMKELIGECSDQFIKLHFSRHHRIGLVKVEKVCHPQSIVMQIIE